MSSELLRPFAFLSIRHQNILPAWVNWILPAIFSLLIVFLFFLTGGIINVFGSDGFISKVLGFVQNLAGFYIAGLAAIAVFNNSDMDKLMPGKPPEIFVKYQGVMQKIRLTRRRFLSVMFAFLTADSIFVTVLSVMFLSLSPVVKNFVDPGNIIYVKSVALFFYLF